ncbi:GlxA family transcriptional regulator [Sedimentitalea sp. JM2-8]|uniref:GlxA family transcriptional regulator n=1 Tax=Sedimentitalea xiamensis TaxID=3050037 RepID=A0ABT7FED0_9RHOB|nr:GlxA family transcriptional regulator [Sedimentitalea xiamensis]
MPENKIIHLGFLIFPGFPMACLTSMIEPLRAANEISETQSFHWTLISETGERVDASAKVWFDPSVSLSEAPDVDFLFLLSPPMGRFADPKHGNGVLRSMARHGTTLGGVSGGVFPLARSGVLAGHTCSVHWCYDAAFADEFPEIDKTDEVIMLDRRCYTVSGAAAAFDLALMLIERALGPAIMTEVACWFQHPLVRGQGVRQRIPTVTATSTDDMLPEPVASAVAMFAEHIETPLSVLDVADRINVSARQLERHFKKATGTSPSLYFRGMRMAAARQLVMYSNKTMADIALSCGYSSVASLNQYYRAAYGLSPSEDRRKINMFRVRDNKSVPSV